MRPLAFDVSKFERGCALYLRAAGLAFLLILLILGAGVGSACSQDTNTQDHRPADAAPAQQSAPNPQNTPAPQETPNGQSAAPTTSAAIAGEISGTVKSGTIPLPGVVVTASNSLTGKKYATSTDVDGSFKLAVGGKGRYVVRAEFSAFAPITKEVLINAETPKGTVDLSMILLSRVPKETQPDQRQMGQRNGVASGMQRLSLSGGDAAGAEPSGGADAPSIANSGLPNAGLAEGSTESIAVSGAMGRNDLPTIDPGEMQDRINELRDSGRGGNFGGFGGGQGGFGGGGFGGGGPMVFAMGGGPGGGGGRGFRNFNVNQPHGSIFYNYGGSPLDARPYALTGVEAPKASYDQNRFGITIGGPLNIPHVYHGGTKTFLFGSYTSTRGNNPFDVFSTVPTLDERNGNFSSLLNSSTPVQLFDPRTHQPIPNNILTSINPAAAGLLPFIPAPNLPGTSKNFHFVSANESHSDTALIRFNHSFGSQPAGPFGGFGRGGGGARRQSQSGNQKKDTHWSQSINGGFNYNGVRSDILNAFPTLGGKSQVSNYNGNAGYTLSKNLFLNSLRFNYNRSQNRTLNGFTNVNDIEGQLGITGVSQQPSDFGLPNLNFFPFTSLQDVTPAFRTTQNVTLTDSMSWSHGKHSWTWGGDYRHQLLDLTNATNARGTFVFSGLATSTPSSGPAGPATSGFAFADFLLGFAQQTSLQSGTNTYHFRQNAFDLYVQDNWRASKNLTLNLGLRYEYVAPFTELNNQLVNLDVSPGIISANALPVPVQPGGSGPYTGGFPGGLINPDRNNFAPRVGLAWKASSKTVVRAGYGINYNIAQYGQMVTQLAFQPPFAVAQTNTTANDPTAFTLQNGFPNTTPTNGVTNTYAVDRNYRLGYVQSWNLNIQQELKYGILLNIGYTGSKGTRLDIVRAPDRTETGLAFTNCSPPTNSPCVDPFLFESSAGSSILHSGSLRVRKRMRRGFSVGGTYTYSKSIDNASSIGGTAVVVAQNDLDLAAERGLSSFDQRHRLTADFSYELPFGKERKWLNRDNWAANALGGITFSGNATLASGTPFSPRILGNAGNIAQGVNGTLRPDLVPGQAIQVSDPTIQHWFNTAAFIAPTGQSFGDAGRNIISGPGLVDLDMAFSKTVQVKEMQSLELRLSATNVFNTAHFTSIDTQLGSPSFGQVIATGSMRKAQFTMRYRF